MKKTKKRSSLWRMRMRKRKRVRVHRHFNVELVSTDPVTEKQTCRTCGKSEMVEHPNISPSFAKRLADYRNHGAGVYGICKYCTKKVRDEQYPLPKE